MRRLAWLAGWPLRAAILAMIRVYRVTLSYGVAARCRFHPSCSAYAEEAIRSLGLVRGGALTAWRVLRCSPLSKGGVDYPPVDGRGEGRFAGVGIASPVYDGAIHPEDAATTSRGAEA